MTGTKIWPRSRLCLVTAFSLCLLFLPGVVSAADTAERAPASWNVLVPRMSPNAVVMERDGYALMAAGWALSAAFFWFMLSRRRAWRIQDFIEIRFRPRKLAEAVVLGTFLLMSRLVMLPLEFVSYRIYHHYGVAVQSTSRWFGDEMRSCGVDLVVTIPVLLLLLWTMRRWQGHWWIPAAAGFAAVSAWMVYLTPLIIDPLFHRFSPLRDVGLRAQILELATRAGVHVNGVYVGQFSATTTEGNAYVTGLGDSQRIVVWDTLLKRFSPGEVRSIVAHELGHYALHHILLGLILAIVGTSFALYLLARVLDVSRRWGWVRRPGEPAVLAIAAPVVFALNIMGMPIAHAASRTMESQADAFSLNLTQDPPSFIAAMQRLSVLDYSDPWPSRIQELVFYTHPSISERIHAAVLFAGSKGQS